MKGSAIIIIGHEYLFCCTEKYFINASLVLRPVPFRGQVKNQVKEIEAKASIRGNNYEEIWKYGICYVLLVSGNLKSKSHPC